MKSLFAAVPRPRCRIAVGFCKDAGRDWSSWDKTCLALVPSALRQGRTRALWPFGGESLFWGRREGGGKGRRRGLRMGTSLLLVPTQTPDVILAVVLPSTSITAGLPFFGWLPFPERSRKFGISACVWPFTDLGAVCKFTPVCSLNCWLTVEERRGLIPGFWSWMKLAHGKEKHSPLGYVFLTWNQLALHK